MKIHSAIEKGTKILRNNLILNPCLDSEILMTKVINKNREYILLNYDQYISKKDILSVSNALKKDFITTGPNVSMFEKKLSKYCNSKYAVSVNSATSALHLSCLSLVLKKNDRV